MPVYLDYNATTPVDPRIVEAMLPYFTEIFGNDGSSTHVFGEKAHEAVEKARRQVATLIGASASEVIFTSGATESNNIVMSSLIQLGKSSGKRHIISSAIEHKAILEPLAYLSTYHGFDVELMTVGRSGAVNAADLLEKVREDTLLVSIMHANNETGVLQPIFEIGSALRKLDVCFHVDAAQTFGKEIDALDMSFCDFISVSAHKIYGPKGIGALIARGNLPSERRLNPLFRGGGQEMGVRSGTLAVPLIVGLGKACELAVSESQKRIINNQEVKSKILSAIQAIPHTVNGDLDISQPHVLNITFPGVDSEALMLLLRNEFAISNGSACTSKSYTPSHVLAAMGLAEDDIRCSVRLSWGAGISAAELPVEELVNKIRMLLP